MGADKVFFFIDKRTEHEHAAYDDDDMMIGPEGLEDLITRAAGVAEGTELEASRGGATDVVLGAGAVAGIVSTSVTRLSSPANPMPDFFGSFMGRVNLLDNH